MSNYATKSNLKSVTDINTSRFAKVVNLARCKSEIDDLDIDKLKTVPVDWYKLGNALQKEVVKN